MKFIEVFRFRHKTTGRIVEVINSILICEYSNNLDFEKIETVIKKEM